VYDYLGTGAQIFVAGQDGASGSFSKLTASSLSVQSHETPATYKLTVNDPSGKYGVIVVCDPSTGTPRGYASFATLSETREINIFCGDEPANESLSGGLTWASAGNGDEVADIWWGLGRVWPQPSDGSSSYSIHSHLPSNDLVALYYQGSPTPILRSVMIQRNVGSGTFDIDFNDSSKFVSADTTSITLDCPSSKMPSGTSVAGASFNFATGGSGQFRLL